MNSEVSDNVSSDEISVGEIAEGIENTPMWRMIAEVAESEGVELFDIEFPRDGGASGRSGVVRVYITKAAAAIPVTAAVQRAVRDAFQSHCTRSKRFARRASGAD